MHRIHGQRSLQLPARRRARLRGLTLVEISITVAVIAVIATLAVQRVHAYVSHARSAEAIYMVGAITRTVLTTFAVKGEESSSGDVKVTGGGAKKKGASVTHGTPVCDDAVPVPANLNDVKRRKYQPRNTPNSDYGTGTTAAGWKCIGFQNDQPQYYQYGYKLGGPPITVTLPGGGSPNGAAGGGTARQWSVFARGDTDGDNKFSWFAMTGYAIGQEMTMATAIATQDQEE